MATVVTRFIAADKFKSANDFEFPKFTSKLGSRYNPKLRSHLRSKIHYRNYFLASELEQMPIAARRNIVQGMIKRLNDPVKLEKETNTRILIYRLRLQALVLGFFGGMEFPAIAKCDLSGHLGYYEPHTDAEDSIISGYFDCITKYRQRAIFDRNTFAVADKTFGKLRHVDWLCSFQ